MSKNNFLNAFHRSSRLLWVILALAFILRFWQLGQNPPALDWDEVAHGYNAYSLLKTGRDEYGLRFPLYFRSFDDYKPPLYTYLTVPSVFFFGLNDWAVRFPSAFLGFLAVFFTYFLVRELLGNRAVSLLATFFMAVSPWHLQFSRVALETNIAVTFSFLGAWAFLVGVKRNPRFLILAAFSFGLNLWVYHNSRVFVPLLSLSFLLLFLPNLLKIKRHLVVPILISLLFTTPLFVLIIREPLLLLRFSGTSVFTQPAPYGQLTPVESSIQKIDYDLKTDSLPPFFARLIHNRRIEFGRVILDAYFSHLQPDFLFFKADLDRHHAPQMGLLYLWDLPFILLGIYFLIAKSFDWRAKAIVFLWFLFSPVASSVTRFNVPHALRTEMFLPTFQIFTALGVWGLWQNLHFLKQEKIRRAIFSLIFLLFFLNFFFYLHQYWVHMPTEYSQEWLYGRKEAALFTDNIKHNYQKVIVSTRLESPHMFFLYYLKYDPQKYLVEGGTVSGGFLETGNHFDRYSFRPIDYAQDLKKEKGALLVGLPWEFPKGIKALKTIYYLNGKEAIKIVEVK